MVLAGGVIAGLIISSSDRTDTGSGEDDELKEEIRPTARTAMMAHRIQVFM